MRNFNRHAPRRPVRVASRSVASRSVASRHRHRGARVARSISVSNPSFPVDLPSFTSIATTRARVLISLRRYRLISSPLGISERNGAGRERWKRNGQPVGAANGCERTKNGVANRGDTRECFRNSRATAARRRARAHPRTYSGACSGTDLKLAHTFRAVEVCRRECLAGRRWGHKVCRKRAPFYA